DGMTLFFGGILRLEACLRNSAGLSGTITGWQRPQMDYRGHSVITCLWPAIRGNVPRSAPRRYQQCGIGCV
ncbi:MAG: hypothetical protein ACRD7E_07480, partial [Bryobacteraceae bacterium]